MKWYNNRCCQGLPEVHLKVNQIILGVFMYRRKVFKEHSSLLLLSNDFPGGI